MRLKIKKMKQKTQWEYKIKNGKVYHFGKYIGRLERFGIKDGKLDLWIHSEPNY